LKERTLGVEVFGRDPHYDTNLDPIVRTTAGEIRKRIAQYYHEPGRDGEVRIDLPIGSYVPEFRLAAAVEKPAIEQVAVEKAAVTVLAVPRKSRRALWLGAFAMLVPVLGVTAWLEPWTPHSAIDLFWKPVLESSGAVLVCVGQHHRRNASPEAARQEGDGGQSIDASEVSANKPDASITLTQLYWMSSQNIVLTDVSAITMVTGLLQSKRKGYRIGGQGAVTLADLRNGPAVLIGAFNNEWTLRTLRSSRFTFEKNGTLLSIADSKNPAQSNWVVDYAVPYRSLTDDYAVISRVLDPTSQRIVVVVAGIAGFGTMAAAEFVSDPENMEAFAKQAPRGWEHKNIELVIGTKVIDGNHGPPRVLASNFW
jgi:hypothetical protein